MGFAQGTAVVATIATHASDDPPLHPKLYHTNLGCGTCAQIVQQKENKSVNSVAVLVKAGTFPVGDILAKMRVYGRSASI
jgi:hypothetical protein